MYSFLTKNGQTLAFMTGVVLSVLFIILVMVDPTTEGLNADTFTGNTPAETYDALTKLTQFDFGLYITYFLLALTAIVTIGFGLYHFISLLIDSPKKAMTSVAIIGGLILFFIIGKATSPSVDSKGVMDAANAFVVNDSQRGLISGAINMTVIVLVLAVVTLVLAEIRNIFK
jgi:hypothetical protein